jgi:hypothetical protein
MAHTGLSRRSRAAFAVAIVALLASAHAAAAATYTVGPGQTYATPSQVPWESLQPGDQVLIHWRSTPYKDKWVICRQGTEALLGAGEFSTGLASPACRRRLAGVDRPRRRPL